MLPTKFQTERSTFTQFGHQVLAEIQEHRIEAFGLRHKKNNIIASRDTDQFLRLFARYRERFFHEYGNSPFKTKLGILVMRQRRRRNYSEVNFFTGQEFIH